jgi:hypothetical protein
MILMKMCDTFNRETKYDWFTGNSEFAMRLEREGAMIDAEVRISLIWNCRDDLDLHVTCPSGEEIWYSAKKSTCGGFLDVDMNASDPYSRNPVENIVWANNAPSGEYRVVVNNYCQRSGLREVPFILQIAVLGRQTVEINASWRMEQGTGDKTLVHTFMYDSSESEQQDPHCVEDPEEADVDAELPTVQHMNRFSGSKLPDSFASTLWLAFRERNLGLTETAISLNLQSPSDEHGQTVVCPQWCFLQAIWAYNLEAAGLLMTRCGKAIDINHKYRWDVIPWDENVAQMCWRDCHGDELRDRPRLNALAWLAAHGADFSQVKLNFHRWRKPFGLQESQIRTFDRLVWHLSDENGFKTNSQSASRYLENTVRQLVRWGCNVPEDLSPDFKGEIEWGVNGKRPSDAISYCYGNLDVEKVHAAVRVGKATTSEQLMAALCVLKRVCSPMHSSTKCRILSFLHPGLGRGLLSYSALQQSEGGRVKNPDNERVECSETSAPPRGYVCGRCRQAGHWRKFCPRLGGP